MWQCAAAHAVQATLHSREPIFTLHDPGYRVEMNRGRANARWLVSGESWTPSGGGERDVVGEARSLRGHATHSHRHVSLSDPLFIVRKSRRRSGCTDTWR